MTDKDSQFDETEWIASEALKRKEKLMPIDAEWFQPGGLYYEMRRERDKLKLLAPDNAVKLDIDGNRILELEAITREMRREQEAAKKLLSKLEWSRLADYQLYTVPSCPICNALKVDTQINKLQTIKAGHKDSCELAACLRALTRE